MIGAREENLGSTRGQTLKKRSLSNQAMERTIIIMDNWIQETCYISVVASGPNDPNNFNEAWNHQCRNGRGKCNEAFTKEFDCMENIKVWKIIHKTDVPKDRRLIACKWVFKIRIDGTCRARLVALGYSQVPGVDFIDNFALVVNYVTLKFYIRKNDDGRPKLPVNRC